MKADKIFQSVKWMIKELDRKERIRLCSRIVPEFDLLLKVRKRGRVRNLRQIKEKLSKDFLWALAQEKGLPEKNLLNGKTSERS